MKVVRPSPIDSMNHIRRCMADRGALASMIRLIARPATRRAVPASMGSRGALALVEMVKQSFDSFAFDRLPGSGMTASLRTRRTSESRRIST